MSSVAGRICGRRDRTRLADRATLPYLDGFVVALNEWGEWRFSTFLGGGAYDEGRTIAVDPSGRISVAGFSTSADFAPHDDLICEGAFQCPAFVVQLDSDGSTLLLAARSPTVADYVPLFDTVVMAIDRGGTLLLATNRQSTVTFGRMSHANAGRPPIDRPCAEIRLNTTQTDTMGPEASSCKSGFSSER